MYASEGIKSDSIVIINRYKQKLEQLTTLDEFNVYKKRIHREDEREYLKKYDLKGFTVLYQMHR